MDTLVFLIIQLMLGIPLASAFLPMNYNAKTVTVKNDVGEGSSTPSDTLIKWIHQNVEDQFDQVGKKMNNVNRNVETLGQEFETLSENENFVELRLDTLEDEVRQKISAVESGASKTLESVLAQLRALEPFANIERRLDKVKAGLGDKLTTEIFFIFNILWIPLVTFASLWLQPVG